MKKLIIFFVIIFLGISSVKLNAQTKKSLDFEIIFGYAWAHLKKQADYQFYPLFFNFIFKKILPLNINFQLEPYLAYIKSPRPNLETGSGLVFRWGLLPEKFFLQPYIKLAAGLLYTSQHNYHQGTQFNFFEYGSGGLAIKLKNKFSFILEYRFRHLSNLGIKRPNSGINHQFYLFGLRSLF